MATAETRRKEEESRTQDGSPLSKGSEAIRSSHQLDFVQAMTDFKLMFPTLDNEVIEAVLRANDGAVDATIDQLLTMTIDENMSLVVTPELRGQPMALYNETDHILMATHAAMESPPSYSEAMRSAGERDHPTSMWITPIGVSLLPRINSSKLDEDFRTEPDSAMAQISPAGLSVGAGLGLLPKQDTAACAAARTSVGNTITLNTTRKKHCQNWNPPLLGNLADDFLRFKPSLADSGAKIDSDKMSIFTSAPASVLPLSDVRPKVYKNLSKSEKVSRDVTLNVKESKSKHLEKKSIMPENMTQSFSLANNPSKPCGVQYRNRSLNSSLSPTHHSVIIETHDFSKDMLQQRIKENERQRRRTSDPEIAQYLEDERLALAIQNSEFLQELRSNEDFMKILERDQTNDKHSQTLNNSHLAMTSPAPVPEILHLQPSDDAIEGYGDKDHAEIGPSLFSQMPIIKDKDEDIELRKQLSGMGKASRKQMATLARNFFWRKKKSSKQILSEKLAPSMMNLLEDEDEEEVEDLLMDRRRDSSLEIEPLPSSLVGIPGYWTVQQPPYKPDGVTTYFDNKNVDMV